MLLVAAALATTGACARSASTPRSPTSGSSGDLEARVVRLEQSLAKNAEALEFLRKVYEQQKAQQAQQEADEIDPDAMFAVDIAADVTLGKVDGPASAPVTIIKVFDFACPYCQRMAAIMDELVAEYAGKVRVVYKDLVVHPDVATSAHLAACAAAKQGKYKVFKNAVWDEFLEYAKARDATRLGEANLLVVGKRLGLDGKRLATDMNSAACKAILQADMAELDKFNVSGTPAFFVNGTPVAGALPKEAFKQLVDQKLREAEQSGVSGADYYDKVVMTKGLKKFRSAADPK